MDNKYENEPVVINVDHLTKDYGYGRGVFDVSIKVHRGECYGYLGPNGAGKSTFLQVLSKEREHNHKSCQCQRKTHNITFDWNKISEGFHKEEKQYTPSQQPLTVKPSLH